MFILLVLSEEASIRILTAHLAIKLLNNLANFYNICCECCAIGGLSVWNPYFCASSSNDPSNYWVGFCPLSGVPKTREHGVLETETVSKVGTSVRSLRKS